MQVMYHKIAIDNCWLSRASSPGINKDGHASVDLAFITDAGPKLLKNATYFCL